MSARRVLFTPRPSKRAKTVEALSRRISRATPDVLQVCRTVALTNTSAVGWQTATYDIATNVLKGLFTGDFRVLRIEATVVFTGGDAGNTLVANRVDVSELMAVVNPNGGDLSAFPNSELTGHKQSDKKWIIKSVIRNVDYYGSNGHISMAAPIRRLVIHDNEGNINRNGFGVALRYYQSAANAVQPVLMYKVYCQEK